MNDCTCVPRPYSPHGPAHYTDIECPVHAPPAEPLPDHYNQAFYDIINPQRHPGGRTMTRPETPRTSRDQATLLLGCGGFLLMLSLAVAVIIVAWRF